MEILKALGELFGCIVILGISFFLVAIALDFAAYIIANTIGLAWRSEGWVLHYTCTNCDYSTSNPTKFCPRCGQKKRTK